MNIQRPKAPNLGYTIGRKALQMLTLFLLVIGYASAQGNNTTLSCEGSYSTTYNAEDCQEPPLPCHTYPYGDSSPMTMILKIDSANNQLYADGQQVTGARFDSGGIAWKWEQLNVAGLSSCTLSRTTARLACHTHFEKEEQFATKIFDHRFETTCAPYKPLF